MNRRTFIKASVGFVVFLILAIGGGYRSLRRLLNESLSLDKTSKKGVLTQEELRVITAVFEVISPKPPPPPEELLEFVNYRTSRVTGYYREYKSAVEVFESKAHKEFGRTFASLEAELQESIVRDVLLQGTPPRAQTIIERKVQTAFRLLFSRAESRFTKFVFPDLLMFYWSSGAGWASLGYSSYPGVPDSFDAYTRAPGSRAG